MNSANLEQIALAKKAALEVLLHNSRGSYLGLPRTAGWGYPEPYTRDLMFSILGIATTGNKELMASIRKTLEALAKNQTLRGHIPSLAHDNEDLGASDTTPLFLLGLGIFRLEVGEPDFLKDAASKALKWMDYQSPDDQYLVAQQPTSDWRDEQWVLGYGLFVNTLVYGYSCLFGLKDKAERLRDELEEFTITSSSEHTHVHEGLALEDKPYYACWSYKIYSSERFDLLGNSLAILTGIASPARSDAIISWIEDECLAMMQKGVLTVDLPPNFFPFILPTDADWIERNWDHNQPGDYHNGGIWPFVCGLYIAALVAAKKYSLAERKLLVLTELIKGSRRENLAFGFNEWIKAQTGKPMGQDWQTWSAALYLYACKCVEEKRTPYFDAIQETSWDHLKV
ncbi:MAG: glycoside hydrolase 100 family protein [Marinoscillum sp.]